MKKHVTIFFTVVFALLFSSCAWTSYKFQAVQPAAMTLPSSLSKIAIIDRSMPRDGYAEIREGAISGEYLDQDRICRENAMTGVETALGNSPRVRAIRTSIEETGNSNGTGMPFPISWTTVRELCDDYHADALLSLEVLDTDNALGCATEKRTGKNKDGSTYTYYESTCEQVTGVKLGWRLYEPRNKQILDEYIQYKERKNKGTGKNEVEARKWLPFAVDVSRNLGYQQGYTYGTRLVPTYITIERYFYDRAKGFKPDMLLAASYASSGNWEKAANVYQNILRLAAGQNKVCGRAAYNLAVSYEARGDLKRAQEQARVAWMRYGNKEAQTYIDILERRMRDMEALKRQMNRP